MQIIPTGIEGLIEIIPDAYPDDRGWFLEFFKQDLFSEHGIPANFTQDNISFSRKGVIRGMHMQLPPHDQVKLVAAIHGRVLDVVADLRKGSPTFGKTFQCMLDAEKHNMLLIPGGFVHGLAALEDTLFFYKVDKPYHRESETGIIWNDPELNIQWPIKDPVISSKDLRLPGLRELLGKSVISQS